MTTLQYAISDTTGRVLGFTESDSLPVLPPDRIAHVMVERVPGWPEAGSATKVLHIANGKLYWVETATLDELKAYKRAEITAKRIDADADHFTYQGVKIRTADKDMFDLLVADARISKGQGMPPNWPGGWIGVDGIVQISAKEAWDPFFIAMYDAGISNFMYSQQLKAEIEDAATTEQVLAIRWENA